MTRSEIKPITGLRGVAAMLVVLNHLAASAAPFKFTTAPTVIQAVLSMSGYGMTLFFTLSGFVITYNYLDKDWSEKPVETALSFGWRRFSRLYPALALFLFITTSEALLQQPGQTLWLTLHALSIETWLPFKVAGHVPGEGPYHVSWSIGTEIGLYVAFAGFMSAISAGRHLRIAAIAIAVCYIITLIVLIQSPSLFAALSENREAMVEPLSPHDWWLWFFYLSPYYRLLEFGLGAVAAFASMKIAMPSKPLKFGAALALCGVMLLHVNLYTRIFDPLLPIPTLQMTSAILFAVIMLASRENSRINRVLGSNVFMFVGTVSYSLYLFHQMVPGNIGFAPGVDPFSWTDLPLFAARLIVVLSASLAVAWGLYAIVEVPAQGALRNLATRVRVWRFRSAIS